MSVCVPQSAFKCGLDAACVNSPYGAIFEKCVCKSSNCISSGFNLALLAIASIYVEGFRQNNTASFGSLNE